jgi:hypothetical protein
VCKRSGCVTHALAIASLRPCVVPFFFTLLLNFDSILASQQDKASLCADMGSALFQSAATILMLAVVLFVLQKHLNKYIKKLAGHFRRPRCEETGHESPCLVRKVVLFLGV